MLGSNVKVHFAGSDNDLAASIACDMSHINYNLFSCYPFIANKKLGDDFTVTGKKVFVPLINQKKRNHMIMDSGLFTLMFGASRGQKQTRQSLEIWQDKMAEFVKANGLTSTCVEVDC